MTAIPRYRPNTGPAILSAGFRPFFLLAAAWAALAVPLWLMMLTGEAGNASALPPSTWHAHEMVFGYGAAVVAGFLLTSIPNWTGRMPLQGGPLSILAATWIVGRLAVLLAGPVSAAILDLAFPLLFLAIVSREILAGRNWRNLPMLGALTLLFVGNLLVHLDAVGLTETAALGNRIGIATLLMLISFVGGRIVPSFTRNWLSKERPESGAPASFGWIDRIVLAIVAATLIIWLAAAGTRLASCVEVLGGVAVAVRLARWRGQATTREPLLWILHLGYGWLAIGFVLLGSSGFVPAVSQTTALHALTVGAIGTMTIAVMTRATLGHTGCPLVAGPGTTAIYGLVTLAAIARLLALPGGDWWFPMLCLAGAAWSGAFGLFVVLYGRLLTRPRVTGEAARPI